MRALSNLINLNEPDLTLFVGEALVGNDAVDQLTKFNQRLADLARTPTAQMIQGLVLTKMDTIDDKVCTTALYAVVIANYYGHYGKRRRNEWKSSMYSKKCPVAGWRSTQHGVCEWGANHVCWVWADICGSEEAERQVCCKKPAEVITHGTLQLCDL